MAASGFAALPGARALRTSTLRFRDFRFLSLAVLFHTLGWMGEQVVLGWLTLELTDSPFLVGVALGVRMAPLFVLGIPAGVVTDRVDRRRLIMWTTAGMAAANLALGLLVLSQTAGLGAVLLLTLGAGCLQALYQTARQSYAHDIVGPSNLVNGLAILGLAMRLGGLSGSLLAGTLVGRLGVGGAYLVLAVGHLLSGAAMAVTRSEARSTPARQDSLWPTLLDAFSVVAQHRGLRLLILLTAASEVLGFSHQTVLPSLARDILRVGPTGLGALNGARSIGGILGIAAVSGVGQARPPGLLFLATLHVFGAAVALLGLAPSFGWVLLILVVVNAMGAVADILSQSLMQLSVPSELRGRAGGAWVLAIGTAPLGQLLVGALASGLGVAIALGTSGGGLVVAAAAGALLSSRVRRM